MLAANPNRQRQIEYMWLTISALILLGVAVLTALPFLLSWAMMRWFGNISGLKRLAQHFPAAAPPEALYRKQRIAVGRVYFYRNAEIGITDRGLYLWVRPFLAKYAPLLIPWRELHNPQATLLRLIRAVRLTVGNPEVSTLTFTEDFFREIRGRLAAKDALYD